jgi:hypothetical protein
VQEYQNSFQLRSARHRRRNSRSLAPVRPENHRFTKPSKANERLFEEAVDQVAGISTRLFLSLETAAPAKNREEEAATAKARAAARFGD